MLNNVSSLGYTTKKYFLHFLILIKNNFLLIKNQIWKLVLPILSLNIPHRRKWKKRTHQFCSIAVFAILKSLMLFTFFFNCFFWLPQLLSFYHNPTISLLFNFDNDSNNVCFTAFASIVFLNRFPLDHYVFTLITKILRSKLHNHSYA
jgi:hypothetical protein